MESGPAAPSGWDRAADGAARAVAWALRPLRRMWGSKEPLDSYALVHLAGAAGDALVAVALADSVFFSLPVGQAKVKVALYLALTMAPLAVAAPLLVPLLDRGGLQRAIAFAAALGRAMVTVYAAPRFDTLLLFPAAFVLLVLSKVHAITKNGLAVSYAPPSQGLVRTNGRLGRVALAGALVAGGLGAITLKAGGGAAAALYMAAAVYLAGSMLSLRLPRPPDARRDEETDGVDALGRISSLGAPAVGSALLRAANGYVLFLLAFALRRGGFPAYWFGILAAAAVMGAGLADAVAPRFPPSLREDRVVLAALLVAGLGALLAYRAFTLPVLAAFAGLVGVATELGRLSFQSLMQRAAPGGAQGRVFVRYEVVFQVAWVAGALVPAILPITVGSVHVVPLSFRTGILVLALFYLAAGLAYVTQPRWSVRLRERLRMRGE
jgi:hypothetical protein